MLGGRTVETEDEARTLSAFEELAGEDVAIGTRVELPACLAAADLAELQKATGQDCPRPSRSMDPDNAVPMDLVFMSLNDDQRHLVEGTLRDEVPKRERAAVRRRVAVALGSQAIATWREAARDKAKA